MISWINFKNAITAIHYTYTYKRDFHRFRYNLIKWKRKTVILKKEMGGEMRKIEGEKTSNTTTQSIDVIYCSGIEHVEKRERERESEGDEANKKQHRAYWIANNTFTTYIV